MGIAGLVLIVWSTQFVEYVTTFPWLMVLVVVLGLVGLVAIVTAWSIHRLGGRIGRVTIWTPRCDMTIRRLGDVGVSLCVHESRVRYGRDRLQPVRSPVVGARHESLSALDGSRILDLPCRTKRLHVPPRRLARHHPVLPVSGLSNLHADAGARAVGECANVVNTAAWMMAVVLIFCLLPRQVRPAAIVIGSISVYVGYAVGGVTDALFVPLLVAATYRWDRFGSGRNRVMAFPRATRPGDGGETDAVARAALRARRDRS